MVKVCDNSGIVKRRKRDGSEEKLVALSSLNKPQTVNRRLVTQTSLQFQALCALLKLKLRLTVRPVLPNLYAIGKEEEEKKKTFEWCLAVETKSFSLNGQPDSRTSPIVKQCIGRNDGGNGGR